MTGQERPLALITGGTSGIGFAAAKILCDRYNLALVYKKNHERAKTSVDALRELCAHSQNRSKIESVSKTIKDGASAKEILSWVKQEFGTEPEVLINAAGDTYPALFLMTNETSVRETFDSHVFGVISMMQTFLPAMCKKRFGRVINFSSRAVAVDKHGHSIYGAAKAAVEIITISVALEVAHRGVTVNALAPGLVDTPLLGAAARNVGNLIDPHCLAKLIDFLISKEAQDINGSVFPIRGPVIPTETFNMTKQIQIPK